jgi:UPF0271 protein
MQIDINCDMGESHGTTKIGNDAGIMPYISSANIACGFHGGDPVVMRETILLAMKHGVAIGAHPSYPDLEGFGRREMNLTPPEVYALVQYQVGALKAMVEACGGHLHHVKPHGALYNAAARDGVLSRAIIEAVRDISTHLVIYGLAGSETIRVSRDLGQPFAEEVFADRSYRSDGSLTPRAAEGAMLDGAGAATEQVLQMVNRGMVTSTDGRNVAICADTVCIHGDGAHALPIARSLHESLTAAGITLKPFTFSR